MKTVLITGATSGIGYELSKLYAIQEYQLLLVASNEDKLIQCKHELQALTTQSVHVYAVDLSTPSSANKLYQTVKEDGHKVDVLINNAGFGLVGSSDTIDIVKDENMMYLNMISLTLLCKLFISDMYAQHSGKVLNVSSTGAFQAGPYTSTYFASKAFVLSYTRALRFEARPHKVQVSVLCPGATKTLFFEKEGMSTPTSAMTAKKVAEIAYKQFHKNKAVIIPGLLNKIMIRSPAIIKENVIASIKRQSL